MTSPLRMLWGKVAGLSNFCMVGSEHFVKLLHGSFWGGRIAIQRNAVLLHHLKTILRSIFPLNCSQEPFCNICERFEAGRKFAVFSATSTRNCNFQRQVPGNCSDKEPSFLADYQRITAFMLFYRDRRDRHIFGKIRHFLSKISLTHATGCCDNLASKQGCVPKNRKLPYHLRERYQNPGKDHSCPWKIKDNVLSYKWRFRY